MPNRSKQKGDRREREIRDYLVQQGFQAVRARGSDGRSLGQHEQCDLLVNDSLAIQIKGRNKVAGQFKPTPEVPVVMLREDGGSVPDKTWVVMTLPDWIRLNKG